MTRIVCSLVLLLGLAAPAVAQDTGLAPPTVTNSGASGGDSSMDLAVVLAQEKVILGPRIRIGDGLVVGGIDALFIYKTSDTDDDGYEDSFLGNLFSLSLGVQSEVMERLWLSTGSGFDAWYLWGIDLDEAKFALPVWAEARYWVTPQLSVFLNGKFNLIASDGLDFGRTREQVAEREDGGVPLMITVGVGTEL